MSESLPTTKDPAIQFVFPNIENESGEIERVAEHFKLDKGAFCAEFEARATQARLEPLTEEVWSHLDNTESWSEIKAGDWDAVMHHALGNQRPEWVHLRQKIESGVPVDAPIIVRKGDYLHLVSGNTRLMISRAAGIIPNVLMVDMTSYAG